MLEEAKTHKERDPRRKVKNLHLQQLEKCKQNRDKDLLTELPKKNFQFGMGQLGTTNNKHIKIKNTVRSTPAHCSAGSSTQDGVLNNMLGART
jgi:hypothetical protein